MDRIGFYTLFFFWRCFEGQKHIQYTALQFQQGKMYVEFEKKGVPLKNVAATLKFQTPM